MRRKPPGKLLPSAHAVDREFRVISALSNARLPGRASRCSICADESVAGTAFYVMDFVDGRVFWEPQMPGSESGRARGGLSIDMNATLARLHSFDPAAIGLSRLRQGRELRRAAGRPLVEAISRVGDRNDRRRWSG